MPLWRDAKTSWLDPVCARSFPQGTSPKTNPIVARRKFYYLRNISENPTIRPLHLAAFFSSLLLTHIAACGALDSQAEFDPDVSGLTVDTTVAPADGKTLVHVTVQLRYAATVPARGIALNLTTQGGNAVLGATTGVTDANGTFKTTILGQAPGVVRIAAGIRGQNVSSALQSSVQFVSIATGASLSFGPIATVGKAKTATVTMLDSTGQRVLYYNGTVAFASSDPRATLPPLYQFTAQDAGQHAFDTITFQTAGAQNITVHDVSNDNITASADDINVYLQAAPMLELTAVRDALAGTRGFEYRIPRNILFRSQLDAGMEQPDQLLATRWRRPNRQQCEHDRGHWHNVAQSVQYQWVFLTFLWHLDETTPLGYAGGNFYDASGAGNTGAQAGSTLGFVISAASIAVQACSLLRTSKAPSSMRSLP